MAGLNVTLPFKEAALALAGSADAAATAAGAANLLLFRDDGAVEACNTDGIGLLYALDLQAPGWAADPGTAVVLGAGGAARGAVAALAAAGVKVRIANRTLARAVDLAEWVAGVDAVAWADLAEVFSAASVVINATRPGWRVRAAWTCRSTLFPPAPWRWTWSTSRCAPLSCFRLRLVNCGQWTALAMLIGQAIPSFEALFGRPVPPQVDVRSLALAALAGTAA